MARLRYWLVPNAMLLNPGLAYLIKGNLPRDAPSAPDTGGTFHGSLNNTVFV